MKNKTKSGKGPYDSIYIANYLIHLAKKKEELMSIMRLMKLAYLSHGWNLANYERPLLIDPFRAWRFGPVIPSIYYLFRDQDRYNLIENKCDKPCTIDDESKNLMSRVFDYYRSYSPYELIDLTHEKGSAWNKVYHGKNKNGIIPDTLIKKDFKSKMKSS